MTTTKATKDFVHGFSIRLLYSLARVGLFPEGEECEKNISKLAKAAKCTKKMARSYIEGKALPGFVEVKRIADWLDVPAGWLLYDED